MVWFIERVAAAVWLLGWAVFGLSIRGLSFTPRFRHINLVPLLHARPVDMLLNFAYYIPLGILATRFGWKPRTVVAVAAVLSAVTELTQLFSRTRFPSTTDWAMNVAGAVAGIAVLYASDSKNQPLS